MSFSFRYPVRMRQFAIFALMLASVVVVIAAYLQALHYPFVSDDTVYITENTKLAGLHLTDLWRLFIEPYNPLEFLPLRDLSYWFDITQFGLNPAAFRLHNIILYLLCLPLVYAITQGLWQYFRSVDVAGAPWAATAVTALFALHPAHVEAVVWISGRKDVLSTLFSLLALWLAMSAKREQGLSPRYATASLLALLAAMLSKAPAVAVAPVIATLWILFWRDIPAQQRRRSQLLWPAGMMLLAACVTSIFSAMSTVKSQAYFGIEVVTRLFAVLGWMARLAVSPESRHFFVPVFEDTHLSIMVALGVAVLVAAAVGMVMILRKRSLEIFALLAFLLLCIPYTQLVPYVTSSLVSDRFLTLAVWPVLLLIVALSWHLRPIPRTVLLLVIALSWGFQTAQRPRDWRNFEALMDADLRTYPGYYMPAAFKIVAVQLADGLTHEASLTANNITDPELRDVMIGMTRTYYAVHVAAVNSGNPKEAIVMLQQSFLELKQRPVQAQWNPTLDRLWEKRRVVLASEWRFLAARFPDDESVRYNAGLWMLNDGRYKNAVVYLRAAIESQQLPESARGTAFKSLGIALLSSGQVAEAEAPLRAALEQSPPELSAYCALSEVYRRSGRFEEAARAEADCPSGADGSTVQGIPYKMRN